jgi:hypothetical protein
MKDDSSGKEDGGERDIVTSSGNEVGNGKDEGGKLHYGRQDEKMRPLPVDYIFH